MVARGGHGRPLLDEMNSARAARCSQTLSSHIIHAGPASQGAAAELRQSVNANPDGTPPNGMRGGYAEC